MATLLRGVQRNKKIPQKYFCYILEQDKLTYPIDMDVEVHLMTR